MGNRETAMKNLEKANKGYKEWNKKLQPSPERISENLSFVVKITQLGDCFCEQDRKNVEKVNKRMSDYFQLCIDEGQKATVEGMALALGISTERLRLIRKGQTKYPSEVVDLINMYYQVVNASLVQEGVNGEGNNLIQMFLLKTNFGYVEQQYINVVTTPQEQNEVVSKDVLEQKYKDVIDITADIE